MYTISNEQQKELLLLSSFKWKNLRSDMRTHYRLGTEVPEQYQHLLALTSEQWQTLEAKLDSLRYANKEKLDELRKAARAKISRENKREYMRLYMQKYRSRKEQPDGQGSRQDGGGVSD